MQWKPFLFVLSLGIPILISTVALQWKTLFGIYLPEEHKWHADCTRIQLSDGRHLAYEVVGDTKMPNAILWFHGIASSRCVELLQYLSDILIRTPACEELANGFTRGILSCLLACL